MPVQYDRERRVALAVVAAASRLARRLQLTLRSTSAESKPDASPVTVADYAVQAQIVHALRRTFPTDNFIAEETSTALRKDDRLLRAVAEAAQLSSNDTLSAIDACAFEGGDGSRTWILDPIDGTRGFIAFRQYCVALALIQDGMVRVGVLGCPNLPLNSIQPSPGQSDPVGCLFHAVKNGGTFMVAESDIPTDLAAAQQMPPSETRLSVADEPNPVWSTFFESVEARHSSHEISALVATILGVSTPPVRMDSQAKYGCMARGDATILLRFPRGGYVENIWDSAPATIVLEEAGGCVTDGRGRPLNFSLGRKLDNDDGIVATNGRLHDAVISAVQQAFHEKREEPA